MKAEISEEILIALRRVIRAIDQHSRNLVTSHGLTGPQALLLTEIVRSGSLTGNEGQPQPGNGNGCGEAEIIGKTNALFC